MKTPVAPLSLVQARTAVEPVISQQVTNPDDAVRRIGDWHAEVKRWQDNDKLAVAFAEGRLTLRTMTHENKEYDKSPTTSTKPANLNAKEKDKNRVLGIINNDAYQRSITNEAVKTDGVWTKGGDIGTTTATLDAGGAGIVRRLNPDNFIKKPSEIEGRGPHSSKYQLGLHNLSASLLNPDKYVLKRYEETRLIVLMPLPLPEDVKIFYLLRQLSKSASFKGRVAALASEFTRPSLASSLDMGTTYVLVKKPDGNGLKDSIKYVRGQGEGVTTTDSAKQCSVNAQTDYRSILTGADQANEITLAYRKWGTIQKEFPVFAMAIKGKADYIEVNINLPGPPRALPKWGGSHLQQEPQYATYKTTGFVVSGKDFTKRKDEFSTKGY